MVLGGAVNHERLAEEELLSCRFPWHSGWQCLGGIAMLGRAVAPRERRDADQNRSRMPNQFLYAGA